MYLELDFLYTINFAKIPTTVNRLLHEDFLTKTKCGNVKMVY